MISKKYAIISIAFIILLLASGFAYIQYEKSQRDARVTPFWSGSDENSTRIIDHQLWQDFLDEYVDDDASGINLLDYRRAQKAVQGLNQYINQLEQIDPRELNRGEQKAYWINAYNALTVALILKHYPINSIRDLGNTTTSIGPWDDDITTVAGQRLSLNDIEHRILRPIWKDARIHFAVNCASIGCPNLQIDAFSSENMEDLLDEASEAFINHPRGVRFHEGQLVLSSIFNWYASDFGNTKEARLEWLSEYADDEIGDQLLEHQGKINYQYDWKLNQAAH